MKGNAGLRVSLFQNRGSAVVRMLMGYSGSGTGRVQNLFYSPSFCCNLSEYIEKGVLGRL